MDQRESTPLFLGSHFGKCTVWVLLSSCGSIFLLSVISHFHKILLLYRFFGSCLSPFIFSFILAFSKSSFYNRTTFGILMMVSTIFCNLYVHEDFIQNVVLLLAIHLTALLQAVWFVMGSCLGLGHRHIILHCFIWRYL